jgi:hypothetical protein
MASVEAESSFAMNETVKEKSKVNPEETFNQKLKTIADAATASDIALVKEVQELAKAGERMTRLFSLTPAACALLFLDKNRHNRDLSIDTAQEYARRMTEGFWKPNNASIGFYVDGEISDGQHRLAGAALAGYALENYVIVFGMAREAIDTVDSPKMRDGASHAKLDGIQEAPAKQSVLKAFAAYMVRAGQNAFALRSASEIKTAIEQNDRLLEASLRMGSESVKNRINPVFRPPQAANVAYLMLKNGWPEQRIREKLALFQSGETQDGENSPFFVAGNLIEASRKARERKNRLTGVKELGVAIYAMVQTEIGCKATKASTIKAEVGKTLPNPAYPAPDEQGAAAA